MKCAFYDFSQAPYSFDFATFLVIARSKGCEKIILVPGKRVVKMNDGREVEFQKCTEAEQHQRMDTIILSISPDAILCRTRDEAREYWAPDCYPNGYTVDMPKSGHMLNDVLRIEHPAKMEANPALVAEIKRRFKVPFALINIRESRIKTERNSNIDEWMKAAGWLLKQGIEPVFVPDSDNIERNFEHYVVSRLAARSAAYRLGLMASAIVTLGIAHGPMVMAALSPYPFLQFRLHDENNWETSSNYWNLMGVPIGSQLPWFSGLQRYVWKDDKTENIIGAMKKWFHVEQAA